MKQKVHNASKVKGSKQYKLLGKRESNQVQLLKLLSEYLHINKIANLMNKSTRQVYKSFSVYRKNNWINQDRTLTSEGLKKVQLAYRCVAKGSLKPNTIRLHDLRFKVKVCNKSYKDNRERLLKLRNIKSNKINMGFWESELITIDNFSIFLNPNYIIFIMKDYYGETPFEAFSKALEDFKGIRITLQKKLNCKLFNDKYLDFKVSKNHYALIKNQIAEKYNKDNKKLYVNDDLGILRLIIDDSLGLKEFEAVSLEGMSDSEKIQNLCLDVIDKNISLSNLDNNQKETNKRVESISETQANLSVALEQVSNNVVNIVKRLGNKNG